MIHLMSKLAKIRITFEKQTCQVETEQLKSNPEHDSGQSRLFITRETPPNIQLSECIEYLPMAIQSLYCTHPEKPNSAPKILNVLTD